MVMAVPVIVKTAVRAAPVFWATANWTVPFPEPDAPCVTERKPTLLVAVHEQVFGVVTEIEADPPAAEKLVVVTPVMIWQPGPAEEESEPQACVANSTETAKMRETALQNRMRIFIRPQKACFIPRLMPECSRWRDWSAAAHRPSRCRSVSSSHCAIFSSFAA
jgi:hypothetical protein